MRDFLVSFMGPLFGVIFDFYAAHALLFNTIVLVYGFVIVLSWNNLVSIRRRLVEALVDQLRAVPGGYDGLDASRILEEVSIPWEETVSAAGFPLVARQTALYPRRKSVDVVRALLPAETLVKESQDILSRMRPPARQAADNS